jgi:prepilin-type N-terminal cleavage/methylation domain-containing protein
VDIRDITTKGTTTMIDRYRRMQREIREEQGEGDEGGFTLIELLIVIVVIGILAAVTVFSLTGTTAKSVTASCKADAKSVAVALEAYRANNTTGPGTGWPATVGVLVTGTVPYLRDDPSLGTAPNAAHYTIDTDGAGGVLVKSINHPAGQLFDGPNAVATACEGLP